MISETNMQKIIDFLLLSASSVNSLGLYNGKTGIALALFEAARFLKNEKIEDKAFVLFQECLTRTEHDFSFENGLSGIGYILIYLITNKFIDADFDDIFKEQCEMIINDFESIDKHPDKLLRSLKVIYFLSVLKNIHYKDIRINQIIEKIVQGIELYLSLQFFDWQNINYINRKEKVLQTYEIYLKLIDFAKYSNFSNYLINSYAELYRSGRIASSLSTGYYLCNILMQNNITQYSDVIDSNISYGLKDINPNLLTLEQKINLTKIIENINAKYGHCDFMGNDCLIENYEKIKRVLRPNYLQYGYQYGLARFLIYSVNKRTKLL